MEILRDIGRRTLLVAGALAVGAAILTAGGAAQAEKIKVAGIYTQPIQQKWDARLHLALVAAQEAGEIEYVFSEKVANTDYVRVLREYAESGVDLVVGEAFGISREARAVADDYPKVAFLMGDPFKPHGSNFAVFDNYIHEPCYLMGMIAGAMTKTARSAWSAAIPSARSTGCSTPSWRARARSTPTSSSRSPSSAPGTTRRRPRKPPSPRSRPASTCSTPSAPGWSTRPARRASSPSATSTT